MERIRNEARWTILCRRSVWSISCSIFKHIVHIVQCSIVQAFRVSIGYSVNTIIFAFDARLIVQERKKEDDKEEKNLKEEVKEIRKLLQLLLKKSDAGAENLST